MTISSHRCGLRKSFFKNFTWFIRSPRPRQERTEILARFPMMNRNIDRGFFYRLIYVVIILHKSRPSLPSRV